MVTFIEDPFSEGDMEGFRKLKEALSLAGLGHVRISMKNIFRHSDLFKVKEITSVRPLTAEEK